MQFEIILSCILQYSKPLLKISFAHEQHKQKQTSPQKLLILIALPVRVR